MKLSLRSVFALGAVSALLLLPAKAVTLNFGLNLEASDTYLGTSLKSGNLGNTEAEIATLINGFAGTSFVAANILKSNQPIAEIGAPDGQFAVGAGYNWLLVKYDGPNGGVAVFSLAGNDALIPYDSAPTWGTGDQYAVSHYAVAGVATTRVPDGGSTAVLLGMGLLAIGVARSKRA